jgi:hypothetical protein
MPADTRKMRGQHQRQARAATASAPRSPAGAEARHRPAGEQRRDDGGREHEIDEAEIHPPSDSGARTSTKLTKVKVPMKANRMQKPMAKAERSAGLRQCAIVAANGDVPWASRASA